jgi:hypothetical protein
MLVQTGSLARAERACLAQPEYVDDMLRLGETVGRSRRLRPLFDSVGFDLDRQPAVSADQVMVMTGRAGAIQALTVWRLKRVGVALDREVGQCPVYRGQADRRPGLVQIHVQPLGTDESLGRGECLSHCLPLPRIALHDFKANCRPARCLVLPETLREPSSLQTT